MRTLNFIVEHQIIKKDPACDFTGLVRGTEGYLKAEFLFSPEWKDCVKVIAFRRNGRECEPQILKNGKSCMIPKEALIGGSFDVQVLGRKGDLKITTNRVVVEQNGGKA